MKLMIRFCLICVFLFRSFSGNAGEPLKHADSLYNAANYSCAALEYEWVNYETSDNNAKSIALLKKSYCYKKQENFTQAAATLKRIKYNDLSDTLELKIRSEQALLSYLNGNFAEADVYLSEINYYYSDSIASSILYLNILNCGELQQWHELDSMLTIYSELNKPLIDSAALSEIMHQPEMLNKKTAKILSYIIPGSGQMYSGHIFRGITSIVFQGALAFYTAISIKGGFYVIGITSGLGTLSMFYNGGAKYAAFLVEKKNATRINQYNQKLKNLILPIETSKNK